jgi:hypothetical protein
MFYLWECIFCKCTVASKHDLYINDRLTCCQCNAEMQPRKPERLTKREFDLFMTNILHQMEKVT